MAASSVQSTVPRAPPKLQRNEVELPVFLNFSKYTWSESGRFATFSAEDSLPLKRVEGAEGQLGTGHWGSVQAYYLPNTMRKVAVKAFFNIRDSEELVRNEVEILKGTRHPHVIQLVGSFFQERRKGPPFAGILLSPAAESDLSNHLKHIVHFEADHFNELGMWLLCLCDAIEYLHSQNIKHKDLKPSNILVDGRGIYIADFGTSRQFEDGNSQSEGITSLTKRFCAPEADDDTAVRHRSADIFSLGCCFLEMVTVMAGKTIQHIEDTVLEVKVRRGSKYYDKLPEISTWLDKLEQSAGKQAYMKDYPELYRGFLSAVVMIRRMMGRDEASRPLARDLSPAFTDCSAHICPHCHPEGSQYKKPREEFVQALPCTSASILSPRPNSASISSPASSSISSRRRPYSGTIRTRKMIPQSSSMTI